MVFVMGPLYPNKDEEKFFPSLTPGQRIPSHLAAGSTQDPRVGIGMIKGICTILSNRLEEVGATTSSFTAKVCSSKNSTRHLIGVDSSTWYVNHGYLVAALGVL